MMRSQLFGLFVIVGLCFLSCRNDTIVGSNILSGENLDIIFVDTLDIPAKTVKGDSVVTFINGNNSLQTYLLGKLENPFFGLSEADIYVNSGIALNGILPDFRDNSIVVDSIVLALKLDTLGLYGDPESSYDIEVFRLTENIMDEDTIYSDSDFDFEMMAIGSVSNYIVNKDSILGIMENGEEFDKVASIRIPIDISLAQEIVADTQAVKNDTLFSELFKGFRIHASTSASAMLSVDLSNVANLNSDTELAIYYHTDTLENLMYGFNIGLVKSNKFTNDYTGSDIGSALIDDNFGDSLLFVQSMAGTNIEFDLNAVSSFSDRLLNHAELVLTVANMDGDDLDQNEPIQILLASEINDNGKLSIIDDINIFGPGNTVESFEENGIQYFRYNIRITNFVSDVLKGLTNSNILTISAILKPERPNRSIILGPKHSTFPAKLNLTFTKP